MSTREDMAFADYRAAELAHREASLFDDTRHTCSYCPSRWHPVTILVGWTPGGDECRACPKHLGELLADRATLVAAARPVVSCGAILAAAVSRGAWA